MKQKTAIVLVSSFPPLGTVGASTRIVRFLQYGDHNRWQYIVFTPKTEWTTAPQPEESGSIAALIPPSVIVYRKKALLRIPKRLWERRRSVPAGPETPSRLSLLGSIARFIKTSLLIPDEDILWVLTSVWRALWLARRHRVDVVYASAPYYSTLILGYLLRRLLGVPLVVDLRDDWEENRRRQGKAALAMTIELSMERRILSAADGIMVPTEEGAQTLISRFAQLRPEKIRYIPNGSDLSEFAGAVTQPAKSFVIACGSGNLTPRYRDLRPFLQAFASFLNTLGERRTQACFQVLGTDVASVYREDIRRLNIRANVSSHVGLSRMEYIRFLKSASCLLLVQMDTAQSSLPGTLYEYLACGRIPVLLIGGKGATRNFVLQRQVGFAFAAEETDAIKDCLIHLHTAWEKGMPLRGADVDLTRFDRRETARQFEALLEDVAARSGKAPETGGQP